MQAYGISTNERVGVPANTRRALSEAVKRSGGKPLFLELDADLAIVGDTPGLDAVCLAWAQPVAGMPAPPAPAGRTLFVDYARSLPAPLAAYDDATLPAAATLWGLHLSRDSVESGALLAFADEALYRATVALLGPEDLPDLGRALAQCRRLGGAGGLAARQDAVYTATQLAMEAAVGVPLTPLAGQGALPHGLAVRVPDEVDVATFLAYGRAENVPVGWLPELQPIFYVHYQVTPDPALTRRTAAHLARWLVAPLGPDYTDEEVTHAVLSILKPAEYLGVRWYTDHARAAWYADLMTEWYGPTHDAYRPAFALAAPAIG
jgi:hypothetical protein